MISFLVPAYNEQSRIGATIRALQSLKGEQEIIVIDDGSHDDTVETADNAGADVVLRQPHAGKGQALNAGASIARGAILVLIDADLGDSASEAASLISPVAEGRADMTIATLRGTRKGGGMGLVVRLARWGIARLTRRRMEAPLSGQRALSRDVLHAAGGFAPGWGAEVALTIAALRADFRVVEVPTTISHRVTGRSMSDIGHRAQQFLAVARVLWRLRKLSPRALPPEDLRMERP